MTALSVGCEVMVMTGLGGRTVTDAARLLAVAVWLPVAAVLVLVITT